MPRNSIGYEGRIISRDREQGRTVPLKFTQSQNGMCVLNLLLVEQHSTKKAAALRDPNLKHYAEEERNASKGADDYINTTSTWHKLTVFGDKAAEYAQDPDFNHGALITVVDASYTEEEPWETTQGGVKAFRAGRPETIGDRFGSLEIKFAPNDPQPPTWDGESAVARPGGNGGGGGQSSMPAEEDGF